MKNGAIFTFQLFCLWLLNQLGYWVVSVLHLPVPGNVMGMLILFILLITGIVRLEWIKQASAFLIKHLAFFFIPIAVGLMDYGDLFVEHGLSIVLALFVSAGVGFWATGYTAQSLSKKREVQLQHERIGNYR